MIYCINPNCPDPENLDNKLFCQACNSEIRLNRKYSVVRKLGGGGFGTIWEVQDGEGTAKVLKVLRLNNSRAIELFRQEATVLQRLNHPGIPKVEPSGYFTFRPSGSQEPLHCLVMEKIPGENLQDWLEARRQPLDQKLAIEWLKQLASILQEVHQQKFFHRDIKLANIMLRPDGQLTLIDFGTVKEITATYLAITGPQQKSTVVYSRGYAPEEQENGHTVTQSDFFALGRSFVHLLTGKHPLDFYDPNTGELRWRDAAPDVSPQLADLIDQMMARLPRARPANTQVILNKLASLKKPKPKGGKRIWLGLLGLAAVAGLAALVIFPREKSCPLRMGDYLSCGEESLLSGESIPDKQQGITEFALGNYTQAIKSLESARTKAPRDPEILIYLNNAQIAAKEADYYTIAVAVTLNSGQKSVNDSGVEILRGVAQAQQEVNQGQKINGKMLRVAIADDGGKVDQGQEIAKALGDQDDILAVVGHHSSELTEGAVEVYKQNKLVLISPSSTLTKIPAAGNFFFRTIPGNPVIALLLAQNIKNKFNQNKAAVFYNSDSLYSSDMKEEFITRNPAVKVVKKIDFSDDQFNAQSAVAEAENLGAKMLVLFPSVKKRENGRKVIKANYERGRYCIMEPSGLYESETLNEVGQEAENLLIMSNPWQREENPEFTQQAYDLWQGHVNWRTALAYDATRALIAALANKSQANRSSVQQALADPNFKTSGATGTISFEPNGDRNEQIQTLSIVVASGGGYKFVPINKAPSIDCDRP